MNAFPRPHPLHGLVMAVALSMGALAQAQSAPSENALEPVYLAGSQYTAVLQPQLQQWTLAPAVGQDLQIRVAAPCPHQTVPGKGLWLVGRDADGGLALVAPSATPLPAGHSGRIALKSCEDAGNPGASPAFGVPAPVLELLAAHSGAVLVDG